MTEPRDRDLSAILADATKNLNESEAKVAAQPRAPAPPTSPPPPATHNQDDSGERFVLLSDNLGEVMLEAARAQLTLAENHYREVQAFVEDMRHSVKRKHDEYLQLVRKLEDFSSEMLEMHSRFHSGINTKPNGQRR